LLGFFAGGFAIAVVALPFFDLLAFSAVLHDARTKKAETTNSSLMDCRFTLCRF
jgi:hypothetical protein